MKPLAFRPPRHTGNFTFSGIVFSAPLSRDCLAQRYVSYPMLCLTTRLSVEKPYNPNLNPRQTKQPVPFCPY